MQIANIGGQVTGHRQARACERSNSLSPETSSQRLSCSQRAAVQSAARFLDGHNAVDFDVLQRLPRAAGPEHFKLADQPVLAQAEVHPRVTRAGIAHCGSRLVPLRRAVLCGDTDLRTQSMRFDRVPTSLMRIQWQPLAVAL